MQEIIRHLRWILWHCCWIRKRLTSTENALTEYMIGEATIRAAMGAREALELLQQ